MILTRFLMVVSEREVSVKGVHCIPKLEPALNLGKTVEIISLEA